MKTGLVRMDGAGGTAKCLEILALMGINSKAVVDLDFAFRQAVKSKLVAADDPDVDGCKKWFGSNAAQHGITLAQDGFPQRSKTLSPEEAYRLLAEDKSVEQCILSLHTKLKAKNIWLWKCGAIEVYYGLGGKNDVEAIREVKIRLRSEPAANVIPNVSEIQQMVKWLFEN